MLAPHVPVEVGLPRIPVGRERVTVPVQGALLAHGVVGVEPDGQVGQTCVLDGQGAASLHDHRLRTVDGMPFRGDGGLPVPALPATAAAGAERREEFTADHRTRFVQAAPSRVEVVHPHEPRLPGRGPAGHERIGQRALACTARPVDQDDRRSPPHPHDGIAHPLAHPGGLVTIRRHSSSPRRSKRPRPWSPQPPRE